MLTADPEEEERARLRLEDARKAREARRQEMQKRKEAAQKALEAEQSDKLHSIEFSHTDQAVQHTCMYAYCESFARTSCGAEGSLGQRTEDNHA